MSTKAETKINKLLQSLPSGIVVFASWLNKNGYSHDLLQKYLRSRWLTPLGRGAYIRTGDKIDIYGAIYALQKQLNKEIHVGGVTALSLQGYSHFVEMSEPEMMIITTAGYNFPDWFESYSWERKYFIRRTDILPSDFSLISINISGLEIRISSPERAMIEVVDLVPSKYSFEDAFLLMESLNFLIPENVLKLLENTNSIKAKRIFLFLAEMAGHAWMDKIDFSDIDLGSGNRLVEKNGVLNKKYKITVPKSFYNE
jgi:hypothetical protein